MKALVLSDSHGDLNSISRAVQKERDISMIIFAGDIQRDADKILKTYPRIPTAIVLGNNDWSVRDVPYEVEFNFGGKRVFLTHGHKYRVKMSLNALSFRARELGADICVFGHTHSAFCERVSGVLMLNPGSAWRTYAVLEVDDDGNISAEIKRND